MSIYYKSSLFNAHTIILIVLIFMNVNKLCLNQQPCTLPSLKGPIIYVILSCFSCHQSQFALLSTTTCLNPQEHFSLTLGAAFTRRPALLCHYSLTDGADLISAVHFRVQSYGWQTHARRKASGSAGQYTATSNQIKSSPATIAMQHRSRLVPVKIYI